jgi:hypothetical protein
MKKLFYLLFVVILVSCGPVTPVAVSPIIKFEKPNILDRMQSGYNFDLNVGIFAVDENILFLFGSMGEFDFYPLQSIVLRSEDGGKHWTEVMKPEQISRVMAFQILATGEGWALIQIKNGGVGPITLFQTTDFGISWRKISEIPKNTNLGFPALMYFANKSDGQLDIIYPYEMPGEAYVVHLSTYDGGKTWEETGRYYPRFEDEMVQLGITSAYLYYTKDYDESLSLDKRNLWKIESTNEDVIISRKLPKPVNDATGYIIWQDWETITVLPLHLRYENGMIEVP